MPKTYIFSFVNAKGETEFSITSTWAYEVIDAVAGNLRDMKEGQQMVITLQKELEEVSDDAD